MAAVLQLIRLILIYLRKTKQESLWHLRRKEKRKLWSKKTTPLDVAALFSVVKI